MSENSLFEVSVASERPRADHRDAGSSRPCVAALVIEASISAVSRGLHWGQAAVKSLSQGSHPDTVRLRCLYYKANILLSIKTQDS